MRGDTITHCSDCNRPVTLRTMVTNMIAEYECEHCRIVFLRECEAGTDGGRGGGQAARTRPAPRHRGSRGSIPARAGNPL